MEPINEPNKINFYTSAYSLEEIADLVNLEIDDSLEDEITAVRIATRRTLKKLEGDLPTAEFTRLTSSIFTGAKKVATLLRTQRAISGQSTDKIADLFVQVVKELGNELGWKI
jgi:hypothetical protein